MKQGKQIGYQVKFSTWKQNNRLQEQIVLEKAWMLPTIKGTLPAAHRLNDYYQKVIKQWQKRWDGVVYWNSGIAYASCVEQGKKFLPWHVELVGSVTYQDENLLSLVTEVREQWGNAPQLIEKYGDVWHLPNGIPAVLGDFLQEKRWKTQLKQKLYVQFQNERQKRNSQLPDITEKQFYKMLHIDRFVLTENGLEFYIPCHRLIQGEAGLLTFAVPLNEALPK